MIAIWTAAEIAAGMVLDDDDCGSLHSGDAAVPDSAIAFSDCRRLEGDDSNGHINGCHVRFRTKMIIKALMMNALCGVQGLSFVDYFAYGSNVHRQVLSERRRITPLGQARGRVDDHRLAFNVRGFGSEPSFASLEPKVGHEVHGVVYRLAWVDWIRLCASEAVGVTYDVVDVDVRLYDPDGNRYSALFGTPDVVPARTLRATPTWRLPDDVTPSQRYVNLIRDGAERRSLDPIWQSHLAKY